MLVDMSLKIYIRRQEIDIKFKYSSVWTQNQVLKNSKNRITVSNISLISDFDPCPLTSLHCDISQKYILLQDNIQI